MTEVLIMVAFILGVTVAGRPSNQQIIDRFVDPVCVNVKVGAEVINKCYTIQEVSEL
jgi:hypothetical protein